MKSLPPAFLSIFDYDDQDDLNKEGFAKAVIDYTQHPYIIFGTVIKCVENFFIISEMYRKKYGEKYQSIEQTVRKAYFDRVYTYLERFDESKYEHVVEAKKFTPQEIAFAMEELRDHYEGIEEYERCARIQKIYNILAVEVAS